MDGAGNGFVSWEERLSWLQDGHSSGEGAEERGTEGWAELSTWRKMSGALTQGAGERPRSHLCGNGDTEHPDLGHSWVGFCCAPCSLCVIGY